MHLITPTRLTALPLGPSGRKKQFVEEEERYPVACVVAPNDSHTDLPPCHCRRRRTMAVVTRSQDPDTGTERTALRSRQVASPSCDPVGATSADTPANPIAEVRRYDKPQPAALRAIPIHACIKFRARQQVKFQKTIDRCAAQNGTTAHSSAIGGQTVRSSTVGQTARSALIDGILARDGRVARRRSREPGASTAIHITQPTDWKHDSCGPAVWGTSIGTEHRAQGRRHRWQFEASQSMGREGCKATTAEAGFADALVWRGPIRTNNRAEHLSLLGSLHGASPVSLPGKPPLAAFSPGEAASTTATECKADRV
ncbi:hypothetical protein CPLU01_12171 [Colletotrichum plurivorum]|uniref:Uncharacterized protein n=1 Tax=Colletotrichum plurivorum TaxID=2175906 RepID=A0A8H6K0H4_9PEZI|nr:hypothetical protein CPLU01_12171 [Colletotrichum plurivorum]